MLKGRLKAGMLWLTQQQCHAAREPMTQLWLMGAVLENKLTRSKHDSLSSTMNLPYYKNHRNAVINYTEKQPQF
jgi:hypothetical protein